MLDSLVMSLLQASNRPLTAYDIVSLSAQRGSALPPAQAYRVLERLISKRTVQRIELLSAYVPVHGEKKGFSVCRRCQTIETFPIPSAAAAVDRLCCAAGFTAFRALFEVSGLCADCSREGEVPPTVSTQRKDGKWRRI
jgi:Fur family zinc uptake transcriptional regulator